MNKHSARALLVAVSVPMLSCGPGAAASAIRPDAPTAAKALEEGECRDVDSGGEPLIVDWKPEQRGDLEVAMKDGVAVMSYSCKGIKLLTDCKIEGDYGFIGMTRREQVVQLKNADEVKANLPLSGVTIGGELARGTTLDIAMMIVGKKRTTWDAPTKDDLKGKCADATHFVRGAMVGAFAMGTGSDAKVAVAAEIFGASAGAGSTSSKQTQNKDGDIKDCQNAQPDSKSPPGQCGAPIRLVLAPIAKGKEAGAPATPAEPPKEKKVVATEKAECPKGMVFADGKCTKPETAKAYECDAKNLDDCKTQCDKGNATSCGILAEAQAERNDFKTAPALFKKACDGGHMHSCANYGKVLDFGFGVKQDVAAAVPYLQKACDAGDPVGCVNIGDLYWFGQAKGFSKDEAKAAKLYGQACDGGDPDGCTRYATAQERGAGVPQDLAGAAKNFRRACDGGKSAACAGVGRLYADGKGVGKNEIIAKMYFQRGCIRANGESCTGLGKLEIAGGRNDDAKRAFESGCIWRDPVSCAVLKLYYGEQKPIFPPDNDTMQQIQNGCRSGNASDCATQGVLDAARGPGIGKSTLQQACMRNDKFACEMAKKAP